ncbi:hypothetical protein BDV96DRAFT_655035 [Lophiotrema nucula]|uniref:Uncharacterized protein n=1 Tax=Lophiotrema nucula TaxID=690887 RepID=A0A6A5YG33_9PLEO|nr:hypothetical protein BDV96DRAFT_655035 [Lophiotrema nucula]
MGHQTSRPVISSIRLIVVGDHRRVNSISSLDQPLLDDPSIATESSNDSPRLQSHGIPGCPTITLMHFTDTHVPCQSWYEDTAYLYPDGTMTLHIIRKGLAIQEVEAVEQILDFVVDHLYAYDNRNSEGWYYCTEGRTARISIIEDMASCERWFYLWNSRANMTNAWRVAATTSLWKCAQTFMNRKLAHSESGQKLGGAERITTSPDPQLPLGHLHRNARFTPQALHRRFATAKERVQRLLHI